MIVTQIMELSKSRCKIYIDQEFAFVLYKGELRLYHVREGQEFEEKDYRFIMEEVLPKRAKFRAMNLLKNREYTSEQLRRKLEQGFYPKHIIDQTLDYVASYHYTDDLRFAVSYIICHENTRSRKRIEQDLMRKGISKETLARAWQEWEAQGGEQDEEEMIRKLLEKKGYDPEGTDGKAWQKMYAFLARKGYDTDKIAKVLKTNFGSTYT